MDIVRRAMTYLCVLCFFLLDILVVYSFSIPKDMMQPYSSGRLQPKMCQFRKLAPNYQLQYFPAMIRPRNIYNLVGVLSGAYSPALLTQETLCDLVESRADRTFRASDLTHVTGAGLQNAKTELVKLAARTGARLNVTQSGDILYTFPANFKQRLIKGFYEEKIKRIWLKVCSALAYLAKLSFGVMLMTSLIVLISALSVIGASEGARRHGGGNGNNNNKRNDEKNRDRYRGPHMTRGGTTGSSSFHFHIDLRLISHLWRHLRERNTDTSTGSAAAPAPLAFLEACFSYVFGDEDPNALYCVTSTKQVVELIRLQRGIVCAEQLAPYCYCATMDAAGLTSTAAAAAQAQVAPPPPPPPPPSPSTSSSSLLSSTALASSASSTNYYVINEEWVLPIVSKLCGYPIVSDAGDIYYHFPELVDDGQHSPIKQVAVKSRQQQVSYTSEASIDPTVLLPARPLVIDEQPIKLSAAPRLYLYTAAALGLINMLLAVIFYSYVRYSTAEAAAAVAAGTSTTASILQSLLEGPLARKFSGLLLLYAVLFNVLPLLRLFNNAVRNKAIQNRNKLRQAWADHLESPSKQLHEKLVALPRIRVKGTSAMNSFATSLLSDSSSSSATGGSVDMDEQDVNSGAGDEGVDNDNGSTVIYSTHEE